MDRIQEKKAYERDIELELKAYDEEIEELEKKAAKSEAQREEDLSVQVEKLREKQREARHKLEEIKGSGGEAWVDLKKGFERARKEMKTAFDQAVSKFKSR